MSKIIFWLVVAFAILFVLRLVNAAKARQRPRAPEAPPRQDRTRGAAATGTAMVRCVECGIFLPRGEARPVPQGFHCERVNCAQHRPAGG